MTNPAATAALAGPLVASVKKLAREAPGNRMPGAPDTVIFDEPLVRFADGDDPLFTRYKTVIDEMHLTPREALLAAFPGARLPEKVSVVSWILPITRATRASNRPEKRLPSRWWSHTRWFGEMFNNAVREHVVAMLTDAGCLATAPMTAPYFKMGGNEKGPFSNWSERHVAYAAGHGTFSLSDGFITEKGIAHRCGSVVTTAAFPASARTAANHYANCLYYADGSCGNCIARCPAGAISREGHDKVKCGAYLHDIGYNPQQFAAGYDLDTSVAGCGLCQTKVPCEGVNPVK
jgi:epoxyqueuosine reductase